MLPLMDFAHFNADYRVKQAKLCSEVEIYDSYSEIKHTKSLEHLFCLKCVNSTNKASINLLFKNEVYFLAL